MECKGPHFCKILNLSLSLSLEIWSLYIFHLLGALGMTKVKEETNKTELDLGS